MCRDQRGIGLLEVLIAATLTLAVALSAYQLLEASRRGFVREHDLADTRAAGRTALEVLASEIRTSGYCPLGATLDAVRDGDARHLRLIADLDGNGVVDATSTSGEDVTWAFVGPDAAGLYQCLRGVDLDGDGAFTATGESAETVIARVVPIDGDGDGVLDPFIAYSPAPPATTRVTVSFGVRAALRARSGTPFTVVPFRSDIAVRNRLGKARYCEDP